MKLTGRIEVISFKDDRVALKLEGAKYLSPEGAYKDWKAVPGKTKKGEVWVSTFDQFVLEACKEFEQGDDVVMQITKSTKGFLNITSIELNLAKTKDEKGMPDEGSGYDEEEYDPDYNEEPATELAPDSREREAQELVDSQYRVPKIERREHLIVKQTCIKAAAASGIARNLAEILEIAKKLEEYVIGE